MLLRHAPTAIALSLLALGPVSAAPVNGDAAPADPYELALRWTLAALTVPTQRPPESEAPPAAAAPAGHGVALPSGGVPDPGGYALMGLGLLAAGLAARHLTGRQRGLSKKT
jgi:hypothetical protein